MKTPKIKRFLKEYFYFSQTERRGIFGLILIVLLLLALPTVYGWIFPPPPFNFTIETLETLSDEPPATVAQTELFVFDPNTATDAELRQLGFSEKNVVTMNRFRSKGGRFRKPEDLGKMFGIKPELVQQLLPYIQITSSHHKTASVFDSSSLKKQVKGPVELNSADTTELIALYRIGPAMARRIVEYRQRLGGFVSLSQLTEIYGFDEDILYDLKGKIVVDESKAIRHDVNRVEVEQLKTHPYFKYKLSNAIVNYRMQHGAYQSLTDLKKIVIVNDSIYQNIIQYLVIK